MTQKVFLDSLGCRLNQSEIASLARQFEALGYEVTTEAEAANLMVVNTCTVTAGAGKDSRKLIRHLHGQNAAAQIAVTGCYAQMAPAAVAALPGVAHVIDNQQKDRLPWMVSGALPETFDLEPLERHYRPGLAGMTRAFLKVQDGCDNQCTFCITRIARGPGRSRSIPELLREVRAMAAGGYQEVVLSGVNLSAYGADLGLAYGLRDLIRALLTETPIPRLRLSSLEPWGLAPDFFELWADARMCRHLHLPLQSGCDRTLKRMRRNTSQAEFRALVGQARAAIPGLGLSTDLIVGFPGEDEAEFAESYAFTAEMAFMKIHAFPYSVREGTPAAKLKGRVDPATAKERLGAIQALSEQGARAFADAHLGQTLPVIWEQIRGASEAGFWHQGWTDNYLRVEITHPADLTNSSTHVRLTEITESGSLVGTLVSEQG